jgi:hypothetical protein
MTNNLTVTEIALVLAVPTQSPTLINEEFLTYSEIIPSEWELAAEPIYNDRVAQLTYQSGLTITAQADRIFFASEYHADVPNQIGGIVAKYVSTLKMAEYQGIGINFKCHTSYSDESSARRFINSHLLSPGEWQTFGIEPLQAGLNLKYTLADKRALQLNINEARLQSPEREPEPVIVFGANFIQSVATLPKVNRAQAICTTASNWEQDLTTLKDLITRRFLGDVTQQMVVPMLVNRN